jgi:ribosomal protein S18 acetylase RimI-like enzyme
MHENPEPERPDSKLSFELLANPAKPHHSNTKHAKIASAPQTPYHLPMLAIRAADPRDSDAIWAIIEPVIRAGDTYTLPRDMSREAALAYWFAPTHEVFVAQNDNQIVGSYYLRPNQQGGGSHVANCGYITAAAFTGQGVARAMCTHSLDHAKKRGYRAMQFNFVIHTNERALRLWQSLGFEIIGRLPAAFLHPTHGYTDAYILFRSL